MAKYQSFSRAARGKGGRESMGSHAALVAKPKTFIVGDLTSAKRTITPSVLMEQIQKLQERGFVVAPYTNWFATLAVLPNDALHHSVRQVDVSDRRPRDDRKDRAKDALTLEVGRFVTPIILRNDLLMESANRELYMALAWGGVRRAIKERIEDLCGVSVAATVCNEADTYGKLIVGSITHDQPYLGCDVGVAGWNLGLGSTLAVEFWPPTLERVTLETREPIVRADEHCIPPQSHYTALSSLRLAGH